MSRPQLWLCAFLMTVAIEVPLVVALTRDAGARWPRRALFAFLAQVITHPVVWFVFPFLPGLTPTAAFITSELWACLAELAWYAATRTAPSALRATAISALANGASLAAGLTFL